MSNISTIMSSILASGENYTMLCPSQDTTTAQDFIDTFLHDSLPDATPVQTVSGATTNITTFLDGKHMFVFGGPVFDTSATDFHDIILQQEASLTEIGLSAIGFKGHSGGSYTESGNGYDAFIAPYLSLNNGTQRDVKQRTDVGTTTDYGVVLVLRSSISGKYLVYGAGVNETVTKACAFVFKNHSYYFTGHDGLAFVVRVIYPTETQASFVPATNNTFIFDATTFDPPSPRKVLLFGGNGTGSDTWSFSGSDWTDENPDTDPPSRSLHGLVYDSFRGIWVMFGGLGSSSRLNDTWEYDGSDWTQKTPEHSPSPRQQFGMAYDPIRKQTVLYGGWDDGTGGYGPFNFCNDTWVWDGTDWTKLSPETEPSGGRVSHRMVYDPSYECIVMHGGQGLINFYSTFKWDGTTWAQITTNTPPEANVLFSFVYDPKNKDLLFYGGEIGTGGLKSETWTFSSDQWTLRTPTGHPSEGKIYTANCAFGEASVKIVYYENSSTLTWNGSEWTTISTDHNPGQRASAAMA